MGLALMEGVERTNTVMMYSNQKTESVQYNLYAIEVDRRRNCYSYGGFGHLAWNCRR